MFWKASSTLLASRAEVSIKDRWFSPANATISKDSFPETNRRSRGKRTGKGLGLLGGNSPEVSQITLVSNQHDDDIGVGVIPQLLEPSRDVLVGLVLADIVDE